MPETDGMTKPSKGTLGVALTAAARIGERLARRHGTGRRRTDVDSAGVALG